MILKYIDLPKVFVVDWMHCVLLGITKALMGFWFSSKHKDEQFFIGDKVRVLNYHTYSSTKYLICNYITSIYSLKLFIDTI